MKKTLGYAVVIGALILAIHVTYELTKRPPQVPPEKVTPPYVAKTKVWCGCSPECNCEDCHCTDWWGDGDGVCNGSCHCCKPTPFKQAPAPVWSAHFSPNGGCTDAIVSEIKQAKQEILMQCYAFNSEAIGDAMVAAHQRGVHVVICCDKRENEGHPKSQCGRLAKEGISVFVDARHQIAHSKTIMIDSKITISGSFNFTIEAEHDHLENLLILRDAELTKVYISNFVQHMEHCYVWGKEPK